MNWLFYAILAPAVFSINNLTDKFLVEKKIKDPLAITIIGGLLNLAWGIIILFFKGFQPIPFPQLFILLFSGTLLTFYVIPYFSALSLDDASRVAPLFQFTSIYVLVFSFFFLGEKLTNNEMFGFLIILIGGFILGVEKIEGGIFKPRKSLYFMLISSLMYSATNILFKFVVVKTDFWLTLAYENMGLGLGSFILLCLPNLRKRFIGEIVKLRLSTWGLLIANDILFVSALFSTAYAFLLAPVALVSVFLGLQPFFLLIYAVILSTWFPNIIKEELGKSSLIVKIISVIIIFLGVYLINR